MYDRYFKERPSVRYGWRGKERAMAKFGGTMGRRAAGADRRGTGMRKDENTNTIGNLVGGKTRDERGGEEVQEEDCKGQQKGVPGDHIVDVDGDEEDRRVETEKLEGEQRLDEFILKGQMDWEGRTEVGGVGLEEGKGGHGQFTRERMGLKASKGVKGNVSEGRKWRGRAGGTVPETISLKQTHQKDWAGSESGGRMASDAKSSTVTHGSWVLEKETTEAAKREEREGEGGWAKRRG
ncbi:hypothetical protein R3P38DRAFT_2795302 [Favolaschia claudopus]|uniref:Uncharacterized protein n=1 Tax=Favolaschia claudopus TaxID=2862362 RepID=A0AAW0A6H9_9AGAR